MCGCACMLVCVYACVRACVFTCECCIYIIMRECVLRACVRACVYVVICVRVRVRARARMFAHVRTSANECTLSRPAARLQFGTLMEVLREMLEQIYRQRRNKMLDETPDGESIELRYTANPTLWSSAPLPPPPPPPHPHLPPSPSPPPPTTNRVRAVRSNLAPLMCWVISFLIFFNNVLSESHACLQRSVEMLLGMRGVQDNMSCSPQSSPTTACLLHLFWLRHCAPLDILMTCMHVCRASRCRSGDALWRHIVRAIFLWAPRITYV